MRYNVLRLSTPGAARKTRRHLTLEIRHPFRLGGRVMGYRTPPKESQFKPGQSGNPAGRRPRFETFELDLVEALSAETSVLEKGVERKFSKQQAMIHALITAAISGNVRAAAAVLALIPRPAPSPAESSQRAAL